MMKLSVVSRIGLVGKCFSSNFGLEEIKSLRDKKAC